MSVILSPLSETKNLSSEKTFVTHAGSSEKTITGRSLGNLDSASS